MATSLFTRSLLLQKPTTTKTLLSSLLSRSFSSISTPHITISSSLLRRALRPLSAALNQNSSSVSRVSIRSFAVKATSSSLNDPSPNWSNRPPKETILLDGCDFNHWLVVVEKPDENMTRDEIIDSYIKTLAQVVGSEEDARMKIYSVSTQCYFAFGALVSEEVSYKIKELPNVRWVLPDSYLDVKNKDYGGEPFIDGKAVPYDPKYHEEWRRNNARANERNRRNDRPRSGDRSRNFDRRRENMQQRDGPPPPMPNQAMAQGNMGRPAGLPAGPPGLPSGPPPNNYAGGPPNMSGPIPNNYTAGPQNMGGPGGPPPPPNYMGGPPNMGGPGGPPPPPNNYMGGPPNMGGSGGPPPPPNNYMGGPPNMGGPGGPPPNYMGRPQNNMQGMPQQNEGPMQNTTGQWPNNLHRNAQQNCQNGPSYQGGPPNYQNSYPSSWDGNMPHGDASQSSH